MPASQQFARLESWQPVDVIAPPSARPARATRLGVVVVAVVAAVGVGLGVMHVHSDPLPAGTSTFVAGGGQTYTSPDGGFQVLLPQAPALDQRTATINGVTVTANSAAVGTDKYVIGAVAVVFPTAVAADTVNRVLEEALTSDVSGITGKLVHKDLTMRGPLPAIEGKFDGPKGTHVHMLVVSSGSTMIMLIVASRTGTDRLYKALENSLIVR